MSGDPFKRVTTGEKFSVSSARWNAMGEAAVAHQRRGVDADPPARELRQPGVVLVRNNSGAARARFEVLGINDTVFDPSTALAQYKNRVVLNGVTPARPGHLGKFVVLLEPIRNGRLGLACVSGVCPVKVDMQDADHRYADIEDGSAARLQSSPTAGAAFLMHVESGTGEQWAVVRLGNRPARFATWGALDASGSLPQRYDFRADVQDPVAEDETYTYRATVGATNYDETYTVQAGDGPGTVVQQLASQINANSGEPWDQLSAVDVGARLIVRANNRGRARANYITSSAFGGSGGGFDATETVTVQWLYRFNERKRSTSAGGHFAAAINPITGADVINSDEENHPNPGAGPNSNGATITDGPPAQIRLLPADLGNPIVPIWIDLDDDGTPLYTFSRPNGVDVDCVS